MKKEIKDDIMEVNIIYIYIFSLSHFPFILFNEEYNFQKL